MAARRQKTKTTDKQGGHRNKPVSLRPLDFDEAVEGLLNVPPQKRKKPLKKSARRKPT